MKVRTYMASVIGSISRVALRVCALPGRARGPSVRLRRPARDGRARRARARARSCDRHVREAESSSLVSSDVPRSGPGVGTSLGPDRDMSVQDGSGERSEPGFFAPQARKILGNSTGKRNFEPNLPRKSTWKRRRNTCASRQDAAGIPRAA